MRSTTTAKMTMTLAVTAALTMCACSSAKPAASAPVNHVPAGSLSSSSTTPVATPSESPPTSMTVEVRCPSSSDMLQILAGLVGGGPDVLGEESPAKPYECLGQWAYLVYADATPPSGRPNNRSSQDFRYVNGVWTTVTKAQACGTNLNGPMPDQLKRDGGCGG